jgi:hypothetical protein
VWLEADVVHLDQVQQDYVNEQCCTWQQAIETEIHHKLLDAECSRQNEIPQRLQTNTHITLQNIQGQRLSLMPMQAMARLTNVRTDRICTAMFL